MASDCANAVRGMEGSTSGVYGQIIRELKEEAATFQVMEIVHEQRDANFDAHTLAKARSSTPLADMLGFLIRLKMFVPPM